MMQSGGKPMSQRERIPYLEFLVVAGLLVFPMFASDFAVTFATRALILCLLALSFDLVWGYAGVMSFGQALFFGAGGYATALLARDLGVSSAFILLPVGAMTGVIVALVVGAFLFTGKSGATMIFVALGTLIASYAAERGLAAWDYVGGFNGIPSFPALTIGSIELYEGTGFYLLALSVLIVAYLAVRFMTRSQLGLTLFALREDEARIAFFGYRTSALRMMVFMIGAAIAGVGGQLAAFHDGFVAPTMVGVLMSTQAVIYVLLGGAGTRIGAVVGVLCIEALRFHLPQNLLVIWPVALGVLLLMIVVFRPAGLVSLIIPDSELAGRYGKRLWKVRT
ncbi:MAG: branched-chain amino acid ABC transporter permease [Mesorhizobium sp.]